MFWASKSESALWMLQKATKLVFMVKVVLIFGAGVEAIWLQGQNKEKKNNDLTCG